MSSPSLPNENESLLDVIQSSVNEETTAERFQLLHSPPSSFDESTSNSVCDIEASGKPQIPSIEESPNDVSLVSESSYYTPEESFCSNRTTHDSSSFYQTPHESFSSYHAEPGNFDGGRASMSVHVSGEVVVDSTYCGRSSGKEVTGKVGTSNSTESPKTLEIFAPPQHHSSNKTDEQEEVYQEQKKIETISPSHTKLPETPKNTSRYRNCVNISFTCS